MKLKSKSLISIILAIMMVVSMVMFAVPANAATTDSDSVGADSYTLFYGNVNNPNDSSWKEVTMTQSGSSFTATVESGSQWSWTYFYIKDSSGTHCWPGSNSEIDATALNSKQVQSAQTNYGNINMKQIQVNTANITYLFSYNGSNTVTVSEAGSTDEPTTTQPTTTPSTDTTYYIGGRFQIRDLSGTEYTTYDSGNWAPSCTKPQFKFTESSTDGLYFLNTYSTIAQLSAYLTYAPYFLIHTGDGTTGTYYGGSNGNLHSMQDYNSSSKVANLSTYKKSDVEDNFMRFSATDDTSSDTVTLWLDTRNEMKLYYTTTSSAPATLSAGTTVYVKSETEIKGGATLTSTLNGATQETEVAMVAAGEETNENYFSGDMNGCYYYAYTLEKDADSINFSITLKKGGEATTYQTSCVEGKQVYDIDSQSWSVYEIDKANAYSSGLWVDVQPNVKNSTLALIKWTNKYGGNGNTGNTNYSLYLPSGVTPSDLHIYSKFNSLTIDGKSVSNGSAYSSLTANEKGVTYTVTGDNTTYKLTVYQSASPSIYTYTPKDLSTTTGQNDKPKVKNGAFMTVDKNGAINDTLMTLAQIKGRGNSSWDASAQYFGKYAYNIKLSSKIKPLDMGGTKAKSFCLLANNMDEAQLRNMVTFQMGEDAKIPFTPNFKCVDWYNNGEYLGTYLITEKVDVGSSKLVDGETVEDYHSYDDEDDSLVKKNQTYNITTESGTIYTGSYQYVDTGAYTPETDETTESYKNKSYLLEFDLSTRATAERCWFKSPKGQYIAVKSFEDLNQAEMLFIIEKWCEAEAAVYANNYTKANELMDLDTFAQVYLVQELSKNLDSCATSYYVYYDGTADSPKWQATPLWDYDWAYGEYTYGTKKPINTSGDKATQNLTSTAGWFAKYKYLTHTGEDYPNSTYSFQAQLANISDFWNNNVKGVWNKGFYHSAVGVFGTKNNTDGKIDTFYKDNSASFELNEARYGFIKNDPIVDWGSLATNETVEATYTYLKDWGIDRISWMATTGGLGIPEETPTLESVALTASKTTVDVNENFTLTASITPDTVTDVTYTFYENDSVIESSSSNTVTINKGTAGTYTYKVTATANGKTLNSDTITVTVNAVESNPVLKSVTLKSDKYSVNSGDTFTLTATHTDSEVECTYTFYQASGTTPNPETDTVLDSTAITAVDEGTYYYYVVATDVTDESKTVISEVISVSVVNSVEVINNLTIWFKGTTLTSLKPSITFDGAETATPMTRVTKDNGGYIGTHYSCAYQFYWYEATLSNVTVGQNHTLLFTTKSSDMNATITLDFSTCSVDDDGNSKMYFAVDNMQTGTVAEDITNNPTAKVSFRSSANMITNVTEHSDPLFNGQATNISVVNSNGLTTRTCYFGDVNTDNTINVKDATAVQKIVAGYESEEPAYDILADFNCDGTIDIKDATAIQKYSIGLS